MSEIDYYELFLKNVLSKREFKITLNTGEELIGIPTCGSFEKPKDIFFQLKYENESGEKITEKFPIDSVVSAVPVE